MLKGKGKGKGGEEKQSASKLQNPSTRRLSGTQGLGSRYIMESRARLNAPSKGPRRMREDEGGDGDHDDDWSGGGKTIVKPNDQLELTEQELKEEFTRVLTANNPHAPRNIILFNHKERGFKPIPSVDQLAIHFALESNLLHKESDEAQRQLARSEGGESSDEEQEEDEQTEETKDDQQTEGSEEKPKKKESKVSTKKLRNQFNFSERSSQTYNNPQRERGTMTEPPPCANFSATANQMEIFDAYIEDLAKQERAKEKKGRAAKEEPKQKTTSMEMQSDDIGRISQAAKVMERMVNQNTFDEIAQDFKYYDDPGDEHREGTVGSLLPLWRFRFDKARKLAITSLCWNPHYCDLFAVAHGSYNFNSQTGGYICCHSLKNPTHPEYIYPVSTGVMSLDHHPDHPSLIAVGLYDGTVAVYNLQDKGTAPKFRSTAKTGKHTDPVWQVCWQKNNIDGNLNFFSVSSDGRVVTWTIVKNELQYEDTIVLKVPGSTIPGAEGTRNPAICSGTAICVNPHADHMYIIGTEEGTIYKCSKAYKDRYISTYKSHHMAVHALRWNRFHPNVFLSCGADWTVKIWDHTRTEPLFSYDLNSVVGDIAWAPYCATVFAAVTADGKAHVFDLSVNKYEAMCVQPVFHKKGGKLTHISFNLVHPIIVVGNDRGTILSMKLSPNLRKALKEKNRTDETERAKMEKLINFIKEPLLEKGSVDVPASSDST